MASVELTSQTPLYWLLKTECVKRHTSLPLLAKRLNISSTALYVTVAGKKHFPDKWRQQIIAIWHLNAQEQLALQEAIALSQPYIKLDLQHCNNPLLRKCAFAFAKAFDNMSNKTAEKILELLNNHVLA